MQHKLLLLAAALCFWGIAAPLRAQNIVQETEKGGRPCFRIDFAKTDEGLVEKLWKNFVKDQFDGKLKKDKKTDEWSVLGLQSSIVSGDKFDLYSVVENYAGDGATLFVWFDVGGGYLNRRDHPERTDNTVDALRQFYFSVRREVIGKELEQQADKLKDFEKKLKNLKKDNEDLHKDIENYKAKIKKAEEDILKNEQEQTKTIVDIETQKKTVEDVKARLDNVEKSNN
ncbi:MAG: hypothetical protein ACK4Q5_00930 [Saprospiraceae bacterium]